MRMPRRTGVTALALAAILGSGAASCARPYVAAAPLDPAEVTHMVEELDVLAEQIGGDVRQRRAGELIAYHSFQDPIRSCMKDAGFDCTPPPFVDLYAGKTRLRMNLSDGGLFAPLPESGRGLGPADDAVRLAPFNAEPSNPGFDRLDEKDQKRYDIALDACIQGRQEENFPPSFARLDGRFGAMLSRAAQAPGVRLLTAQYPGCMKAAGFAVGNRAELVDLVQKKVTAARPPARGKPAEAGWNAAAALDRAAGDADARCRRAAYEQGLAEVVNDLPVFADENAEGLSQVQREWNAMVDKAMGYPEASTYLK